MSSKRGRGSQRAITRGKILKLKKAGLLSAKIDPNKRPSNYVKNQLYKYRGVISGRQSAVKVSSVEKARELREKIGEGGRGRVVLVPREKGERFSVTKKDTIKSIRIAYGQRIEKTVGDKFTAPSPGEKIYYTIPRRRRGTGSLKRTTFASFDEMLFYLQKYEINFEDIEDYIETEKVKEGTPLARRVAREYSSAVNKLKRKKKPGRSRKR